MRRTIVALLGAAVALLLGATPASAHGDGLLFEVTPLPAGDLAVRYDVAVTYENDGDPAGGLDVSAVATDAGGAALAPVPLLQGEAGRYSGVITFPSAGEWTVRVQVADPEASTEVAQTVAPPAATTAAPTTAAPTTAEPAAGASTTVAPPTTAGAEGGGAGGDEADGQSEDEASNVVGPLVAAAIAAVVVLGAVTLVRRRSAD